MGKTGSHGGSGTQVPIYLIPACAQQWEKGINHNDDIMHCT